VLEINHTAKDRSVSVRYLSTEVIHLLKINHPTEVIQLSETDICLSNKINRAVRDKFTVEVVYPVKVIEQLLRRELR